MVYVVTQPESESDPQYEVEKSYTGSNPNVQVPLNPDHRLPVIYGEYSTKGSIVFVATDDDQRDYLNLVIAVCEGEIEGFEEVYINDRPLAAFKSAGSTFSSNTEYSTTYDPHFDGFISAWFYNGSDTQSANSTLVSKCADWTTNHRLKGTAYVYLRLYAGISSNSAGTENLGPWNGVPSFRFKLKGKKVYDPRDGSTAYSTNPALCLRDYMTNERYGKGIPTSSISDTSISAAANDCDTLRDGFDPSGNTITYKSYEVGAYVDTGSKVKNNVENFLTAMNGVLPFYDGQYHTVVLKAGDPVVTLDEDDVIDAIELESTSKRTRYNKVIARFPDKTGNYKTTDAIISRENNTNAATYYSEDGNKLLEKRIDLEYVDYYPRAQDLAELTMNLSRVSENVKVTTTAKVLQAVPGDIIGVTYDTFGWSAKEFRLDSVNIRPDGLCDVELIGHEDSFYTLSDKNENPSSGNVSLDTPETCAAPTIDTLISDTSTHIVTVEGLIQPRIYVSWTDNEPLSSKFKVYIKESSNSTYRQVADTRSLDHYIPNVKWNTTYDIAVTAINGAGYESSFTVQQITVPNTLAEAAYDFPDVRGLELIGEGTEEGKGNDTEFTGKDIKLQWRLSSSNVQFEFGSEAAEEMGATGGVLPFTLKGYRVEVYHPSDTDPRQEYFVTDNNFTYTLDKNIEDGSGTPSRTVTFKVYAVGQVAGYGISGESEVAAKITVTNPQPSLPSGVSITAGFQQIDVSYTRPTDADFKAGKVYVGTSSGFSRDSNSLVYDGPDNKIQITKLADGTALSSGSTYYVRFAAYDDFGTTGITESSEYTVTTQKIISADLDDTAPTDPGVPTLTTGVEDNSLSTRSWVKAEWTASTDDGILSGYVVQYYTDADSTPIEQFTTSTSYRITDAVPGRTYYVKVKAVDWASNESSFTTVQSIVAEGDDTIPNAATSLSASAGLDKVVVTWVNPSDEDFLAVKLYKSTTSGFTPDDSTNLIGTYPGQLGKKAEVVDSDVTNETTYYYKVVSVDVTGNESSASTQVSAAPFKIGSVNVADFMETSAIGSVQLADASVTTAKLNDLSVEAAKLADSAVTTTKIANAAVGNAAIANAAITNAKIDTAAVDTAKIADASITEAKIDNLAVTNAKINDLDAAKITAGTISADRIGASTITADKLNVSTLSAITADLGTITAGTITGALIQTDVMENTGTVSVTNGSAVVTGSSTTWVTDGVTAGSTFFVVGDNTSYVIQSVDSETQITLTTIYSGTTASGKSYYIQADRVVINSSNGVQGYNYANASTFAINTDGSGHLGTTNTISWDSSGTVTVPGTLISGEIVGNTIATAATDGTDWRVEMSSSSPFKYWNGPAGTTLLELDSAGNAIFGGDLSAAGGTFSGDLSAVGGTFSTLEVASNGYIRGGQDAFDTGTGFWLGDDAGTKKFSVGDTTSKLSWDGTDLIAKTIKTASSGERVEINPSSDNKVHFYDSSNNAVATIGYTSDGTYQYIATFDSSLTGSGLDRGVKITSGSLSALTVSSSGSDNTVGIANAGSGIGLLVTSAGGAGVPAISGQGNYGVYGVGTRGVQGETDVNNGAGVEGWANALDSYGVLAYSSYASSGAPLRIYPVTSVAPAHTADIGAVTMTTSGDMYIYTSSGWRQVSYV